MPEIELGSHTIQSHGFKVAKTHKHDWLILLLLVAIEAILLMIEPFHRFVGEDTMTDMKYPLKGNTMPFWAVPILAIVFPFVVFLVYYFNRKDVYDFHHAILGLLFSVLLTAVITDAIKDAVGRPRPDFFWRCFPDGKGAFDPITKDVICHGDNAVIKEGYKSFPSGHTSWSFAGLSYLSWYLAGKIRAFDQQGHIAKLCIVLFPLLLAALVAISRVDDYWHHWQDVFAGALIGSVIAAFCYLQFFPYPSDMNGWAPHSFFQMMEDRNRAHSSAQRVSSFHPQQAEVEASFMWRNNGMESTESSSREYDTTPVLDAMEAGRNTDVR